MPSGKKLTFSVHNLLAPHLGVESLCNCMVWKMQFVCLYMGITVGMGSPIYRLNTRECGEGEGMINLAIWEKLSWLTKVKLFQFSEVIDWSNISVFHFLPTTLSVLSPHWSPWKVFAKPKSEIFGFSSASTSMRLKWSLNL